MNHRFSHHMPVPAVPWTRIPVPVVYLLRGKRDVPVARHTRTYNSWPSEERQILMDAESERPGRVCYMDPGNVFLASQAARILNENPHAGPGGRQTPIICPVQAGTVHILEDDTLPDDSPISLPRSTIWPYTILVTHTTSCPKISRQKSLSMLTRHVHRSNIVLVL
ncbi:hypothetical protein BaRGS_00000562 [Batillaria attramentaria]|uniref:Uncharacterized protein n=1 Tax=Batillaria attramentaria TaxID=370345 RepID=A0ABD0MB15_9CAEN